MIEELIPVIGYFNAMLMAGYNQYQIESFIKGNTNGSITQKQ